MPKKNIDFCLTFLNEESFHNVIVPEASWCRLSRMAYLRILICLICKDTDFLSKLRKEIRSEMKNDTYIDKKARGDRPITVILKNINADIYHNIISKEASWCRISRSKYLRVLIRVICKDAAFIAQLRKDLLLALKQTVPKETENEETTKE